MTQKLYQELRQQALMMLNDLQALQNYAATLPQSKLADRRPERNFNDDDYENFRFLAESADELEQIIMGIARATARQRLPDLEAAVSALNSWTHPHAQDLDFTEFELIAEILFQTDEQDRARDRWYQFEDRYDQFLRFWTTARTELWLRKGRP
jgi:hypothetical protein